MIKPLIEVFTDETMFEESSRVGRSEVARKKRTGERMRQAEGPSRMLSGQDPISDEESLSSWQMS